MVSEIAECCKVILLTAEVCYLLLIYWPGALVWIKSLNAGSFASENATEPKHLLNVRRHYSLKFKPSAITRIKEVPTSAIEPSATLKFVWALYDHWKGGRHWYRGQNACLEGAGHLLWIMLVTSSDDTLCKPRLMWAYTFTRCFAFSHPTGSSFPDSCSGHQEHILDKFLDLRTRAVFSYHVVVAMFSELAGVFAKCFK